MVVEERWLPIAGYEGRYEVSDQGRLRSYTRWKDGRILNGCKHYDYGRVSHVGTVLSDGTGQKREYRIHTLVLEAFVGPRPEGLGCCHNNGNAADNRLENLRWDNQRSNTLDAIRHGTQPVGELHPNAKLTIDDVCCIRAEPPFRGVNAMLGRAFGVAPTLIYKIRAGEVWKSLAMISDGVPHGR